MVELEADYSRGVSVGGMSDDVCPNCNAPWFPVLSDLTWEGDTAFTECEECGSTLRIECERSFVAYPTRPEEVPDNA